MNGIDPGRPQGDGSRIRDAGKRRSGEEFGWPRRALASETGGARGVVTRQQGSGRKPQAGPGRWRERRAAAGAMSGAAAAAVTIGVSRGLCRHARGTDFSTSRDNGRRRGTGGRVFGRVPVRHAAMSRRSGRRKRDQQQCGQGHDGRGEAPQEHVVFLHRGEIRRKPNGTSPHHLDRKYGVRGLTHRHIHISTGLSADARARVGQNLPGVLPVKHGNVPLRHNTRPGTA